MEKALKRSGNGETDNLATACVHRLFEEQVRRTPDGEAVRFAGRSLTYRALNASSNRLADRLRGLGVGAETLVGICVDRTPEMIAGLLAIWKSGGAYVALDPDHPLERLAFMVEDAQPQAIVAHSRLFRSLPARQAALVPLDEVCQKAADEDPGNPESGCHTENLAYIMYTSGSTGKPKGVVVAHRGISNFLFHLQEAFPLTESDRVLQRAPFSFDMSIPEVFQPLVAGACVVMADSGGHRDPRYLAKLMANERVTMAHFVPSMLRLLLEEPELEHCSHLRRIFSGAEALPLKVQRRCHERLSAVEFHNHYGPTEATVYSTIWKCDPNSEHPLAPIGRPISNVEVYILDANLRPQPAGVPGELYIGGAGVARGYLNQPELTAQKFLPNPFSHEPGARLYRTGDLCRLLPDGNIEFLGRLDHQVKLWGLRVELGEVEVALASHPGVKQAVVKACEDPAGDRFLVAYVVLERGRQVEAPELRRFVKERLPAYMVPSSLLFIDALPLNLNGKVDRKALPAPPALEETARDPISAWAGPMEEILAEMWSEVLGCESVASDDNFFHLGGDSISAMRLALRVNETFQVDLSIRAFFDRPTIASLGEAISRSGTGTARSFST